MSEPALRYEPSVPMHQDHRGGWVKLRDYNLLRAELAEKDKRIESLEQALAKASLRTQEMEEAYKAVTKTIHHPPGTYHIITTEQLASGEVVLLTQGQIDAAWKSAWDEDSFDWRNAAERALEKFGILRCEECRGSGEVIEGGKLCGLLVECESCGGHGWIIMSVDVDKYGRFGT